MSIGQVPSPIRCAARYTGIPLDWLEDLDKLYRHLSTKDATEKAVIKKAWDEFRS